MNKKIIGTLSLMLAASFLLSACTGKTAVVNVTPTSAPKILEIPAKDRPYVSITPSADGHTLDLKIANIPSYVTAIEYELLYTASDQGNEIEKGVGDTIKQITATIDRSLLLGTESCTAGCKYKYDDGVNGGTLSLNFITADGQTSTFETPFTLSAGADVKKAGALSLTTENLTIKTTPTDKNFYVILKNYAVPPKTGFNTMFSVFSSGPSAAKYQSLDPATLTKDQNTLTGDYYLP